MTRLTTEQLVKLRTLGQRVAHLESIQREECDLDEHERIRATQSYRAKLQQYGLRILDELIADRNAVEGADRP